MTNSISGNSWSDDDSQPIAKGGVQVPFPWRIHLMLDAVKAEGREDVVSWQSHGRSFIVHQPDVFVREIMPRFFSQTKYASFQRQLNLYGFNRLAHGRDKGAYFHYLFVRHHASLVRGMVRRKIKGTKVRRVLQDEPDFYQPQWKDPLYCGKGSTAPPAAVKTKTAKKTKTTESNQSPTSTAMIAPESTMQHLQLLASKPLVNPTGDDTDAMVEDGDLCLFEDMGFHFLDQQTVGTNLGSLYAV